MADVRCERLIIVRHGPTPRERLARWTPRTPM
jgi:hypothetical protein